MRGSCTLLACALALAGCANQLTRLPLTEPFAIKIIAFNDFHGNLEPPRQAVDAIDPNGTKLAVPAGGAASFASTVASLRATNPNNVVVSAGDMIGASPLVSGAFLDEPTIAAMNLIRVDLNAVGNHEFDRGRAELLRMQRGGCAKHTNLQPCQLEPFAGARFGFLAANTFTEAGATLFPGYAVKNFGTGATRVRVGFIGMTLRGTPTLVTPAGVSGLDFRDEAETANALVPRLRAQGADVIVVVIHQGLSTKVGYNDKSCNGIDGDLLPILAHLDPAVDVVVSGHTHNAYICEYGSIDPERPFLVTSAGRYGTLVTDIELHFDLRTRKLAGRSANNIIVASEGFRGSAGDVPAQASLPRVPPDPAVAALVARYAKAAASLAARPIGRMTAPATRDLTPSREQVLGDLIADAQLAATRTPETGDARIAFINAGGVRADIVPGVDGTVTFGQIYDAQPFGNTLVVRSLTGRQIKALLEQQFQGANGLASPKMLLPSRGFRFGYDLTRPAGARILDVRLDGAPLGDEVSYRVAFNSFLASGGDGFTIFKDGTNQVGGVADLDALGAYLRGRQVTPAMSDRIVDLTPR